MSKKTAHGTSGRHRTWSIVSNALTREMVEKFVDTHPHDLVHGGIHDRDPGTETHGHIFYRSKTQRTAEAIQRKFPVPVIVRPFIVHPGEPGTDRGKFAMARGARYNTHEHPDQQALGKARYGDDEMIATPGWDWRAEVDALNGREGVDPERPARLTVIERLSKRVLAGELTARDVHRINAKIYLAKGPSHWSRLEHTAAEWKRQEAEETARRIYEERRQAEETDRAERIRLAAEQAERDEQSKAEREAAEKTEREEEAHKMAEEQATRQAALEAEQSTPEYQEYAAAEKTERERDDLIDMIAMWNDVKGLRSARSSHASNCAAALGLTSSEYMREDGKLTHLGAVLVYAEAVLDVAPDDANVQEIMPEIRSDIDSHRQAVSSVGRQLAGPELHAAEGNKSAFDKALQLRETYSGYPDLVGVPSPRADIKKVWRDQLLAVS
ncbi:hypothetical protein LOC59_03560 [Arthrobacter sp. zg-Y916]|uniref:hypothetical protein n=1 Tax=Arthrobacter sp. zg-Y916 TaxID=2894190 RepID=UPI001E3253C4|nr:hypothetical protein [Arthrobacter sp. zg-Y916]MCC9192732.1 hypothetical protein [Arthrobacter sp. zg-Y916]